jgi:hypothetical protein
MRYLIVEKDRGLFLGSFKNIFLFAATSIFPVNKVPSFGTEADAEYYIATYLMDENSQYGVIQVESKDKYVHIIDIIKQGYGKYTHQLMDFIPMPSETIH